MVGGRSKKDEGLPTISSTNIFSALESRRKKSSKKRLDKDQKGSSSSSASNASVQPPLQSWAPMPVSVTLWADCEEDDDDYFAMPTLPPLPDQTAHDGIQEEEEEEEDINHGEESEGDEDMEEEGTEENEEPQRPRKNELAADVNATPPAPVPPAREPDRQLSKKQLKMKELAELEAVLAELGLNQEDKKEAVETAETEGVGAIASVNGKEEPGPAMAESKKSSKRRKAKREKSFKEGKEAEGVDETDGLSKDESAVEDVEASAVPVDRSEMLRKLSSMKKKKSFKENDSAAKAAAAEAVARALKLAAAKKKEKTHYNQQPVR